MPNYNPSDYVVTLMPDGSFSVWRDGMEEPYTTRLFSPRTCNCPHWYHRLRHSKAKCKHHEIVEFKLKTGGVL